MTSSAPEAPEGDERRLALRNLQDAFSVLMDEFRRTYVQMAATAVPGMLPATFKCLTTIERRVQVTQSELAEILTVDKGLISRQVSELESLGLIAREPDPQDARVRVLRVTPLGTERIAAAREPYHEMMNGALADWPVASVDQLTTLVNGLTRGMHPRSDSAS